MATVMTASDLVARLAYVKKSGALVQAILTYAGGGVNVLGTVTEATGQTITIGGMGYELLIDPAAIEGVSRETPFDSQSPAAARAAERVVAIYRLELTNRDVILISEWVAGTTPVTSN